MAIGTDRLLTVLARHDLLDAEPGADFLVVSTDAALGYQVLCVLRDSGYTALQSFGTEDALLDYAKANNVQAILTVKNDTDVSVYNLATGETTEADLNELFSHDDDCDCGHCH